MNCNDVKNYIRESGRMCISMGVSCNNCPMYLAWTNVYKSCSEFASKNPEQTLEIVQKWSDEHPLKTRMDVFLKAFPNAELYEEAYPMVCAKVVFGLKESCKTYETCEDCWNTPVEEESDIK